MNSPYRVVFPNYLTFNYLVKILIYTREKYIAKIVKGLLVLQWFQHLKVFFSLHAYSSQKKVRNSRIPNLGQGGRT